MRFQFALIFFIIAAVSAMPHTAAARLPGGQAPSLDQALVSKDRVEASSEQVDLEPPDITREEIRDALEFSTVFMNSLAETRDLKQLVREFFVADFEGRLERDGRNYGFRVSRDLVKSLPQEWRLKAYYLLFDLWYTGASYHLSRCSMEERCGLAIEDRYPPGVFSTIKAHPLLAAALSEDPAARGMTIRSLDDGRRLISTLEKAAEMARSYLRENPPERAALFLENLSYLTNEFELSRPWVNILTKEEEGLGAGSRVIVVELPLLKLRSVRDGGNLKVHSIDWPADH